MAKLSAGFWASNVSLASLDRAKDFVKGSLKALHAGGIDSPAECEQPILDGSEENSPVRIVPSGWTRMIILTGIATTVGSSIPVGYNIGVMNTPAHIIRQFCNSSISSRYHYEVSPTQLDILWSTIVSIFLVGGVTGSLSGGWIADRFGRKGAVWMGGVLALVAAILFLVCRNAGSVEMLLLARLIAGLHGGLTTSTVPMYLTEIGTVSIRGALGVLCPLGLTLGVLLAQILGLGTMLGRDSTWHFLLGAYAILILLAGCSLPFLPESPKYLFIVRNQQETAIHELSRIRGQPAANLRGELRELRWSHEAERETGGAFSVASVARSRALRLPLLLVCALQFGQQCSGINAVFYYSVSIFENAGLDTVSAQHATLGAGAVNLSVALGAVVLVNRYGRRSLALLSCISASGCLIALSVSITYIDYASWMPGVCIAAVLSYVFCYAIGLGPIPYFIGSELFRVGPRPVAMAYGSMANWGGNFLVGMTFPSLQSLVGAKCFLAFAATTILLAIFLWFYLPETKGRDPEDIAEALRHGFRSCVRTLPAPARWATDTNGCANADKPEPPAIEFTDTGSVIIHHTTRPEPAARNKQTNTARTEQSQPNRPASLPHFSPCITEEPVADSTHL